MLDKEIEQADLVLFDLGQGVHDLGGHEIGAARPRRERELLLEPHGYWWRWWGYVTLGGGLWCLAKGIEIDERQCAEVVK